MSLNERQEQQGVPCALGKDANDQTSGVFGAGNDACAELTTTLRQAAIESMRDVSDGIKTEIRIAFTEKFDVFEDLMTRFSEELERMAATRRQMEESFEHKKTCVDNSPLIETRIPTTTFGGFMRSLRHAGNESLRDFALRIGVDPAAVSRHERGNVIPTKQTFKMYADALNLKSGSENFQKFFELAKRAQLANISRNFDSKE